MRTAFLILYLSLLVNLANGAMAQEEPNTTPAPPEGDKTDQPVEQPENSDEVLGPPVDPTDNSGQQVAQTAPPLKSVRDKIEKTKNKPRFFSVDWFKDEIGKVEFRGQKSLAYHWSQIEGNSEAYNDQNYWGQGSQRVTDRTNLNISGNKVFGLFNFNYTWVNDRFGNPFNQRVSLGYDTKRFAFEIGDITASIAGGNELVGFTRAMKGGTFTARLWKGAELKYITSETKATARTITIPGNDSSGPFYLQASQIVDGSVRVQWDGQELRPGEDFRVDLDSGILTLLNGRIVPRTSSLVVTYETYSFNSNPGRIDGWRFETPLFKGMQLGFNMLSQTQKGGSGLRTRTELFYGSSLAPYAYDLVFIPLEGSSILIYVDNIPQNPATDFYFDTVLFNRFYLRRPLPATSQVKVIYTPRPDLGSQLGGNRKVYGVDLSMELGKVGTLVWNGARSSANTAGGLVNGTAQTLNMELRFGKLSLQGAYRDIPPEFITIESVGFRRNEKSYRYDLNYDLASWAKFNYTTNHARIASYASSGTQSGLSTVSADSNIQTYGLNLTPKGWPAISFLRTTNTTSGASSSARQTMDTIRMSKELGQLNLSLDFNRIQAISTASLTGGESTNHFYNNTNTRFSATWRLGSRLSLNGVASLSRINQSGFLVGSGDESQTSTNARDLNFNVTWDPWNSLHVEYAWGDVDSGSNPLPPNDGRSRQFGGNGYNFSHFNNGWNYGYNGNGFAGGSPYDGGFTSYGTRSKIQNLNVRYTPWNNLSLDLQLMNQRALGDYQTNSDFRTTSISLSYTPLDWISFASNWSKQTVTFLTGSGNSATEFLYGGLQIGPLKRWTFNVNFQQMKTDNHYTDTSQTGGLNQYAQNLNYLGFEANYAINSIQSLFLEWNVAKTTGYAAQKDLTIALGYKYKITENLAFVLSYRIREQTNLDPQFASNNYRSRSLDAQLDFNF